MNRRPIKRSLTIRGHRTSVSLEEPFWLAFRRLAAERRLSLNDLATEIDEGRGTSAGLASAIRVWVLAAMEEEIALLRSGARGRPSLAGGTRQT